MKSKLFFLSLIFLNVVACVEPDHHPDTPDQIVRTFETDSDKADQGPTLVGQDFQLGLEPRIQPGDTLGWTAQGAANKPLEHLEAWVGDAPQHVELSEQSFLIHLDANAIENLVSKAPLRIEAHNQDGQVASLIVDYTLRWSHIQGTQKLQLQRTLQPSVQPQGGVVLRALGHTDEGFSVESAFTDDDFEPEIVRDFDWAWEFQWTAAQIPYLLDFQDDQVHFTTVDSADLRYALKARLSLRASQQTWANGPLVKNYQEPACSSDVRFCMHHLLPSHPYGDECGDVQEILACFRHDAAH